MTENDKLAMMVSQKGPFFDGQDAMRSKTGLYDTSARDSVVRNQTPYQGNCRDGLNLRSPR